MIYIYIIIYIYIYNIYHIYNILKIYNIYIYIYIYIEREFKPFISYFSILSDKIAFHVWFYQPILNRFDMKIIILSNWVISLVRQKRDSNTGVFQWMLQEYLLFYCKNICEYFWRTSANSCFWKKNGLLVWPDVLWSPLPIIITVALS